MGGGEVLPQGAKELGGVVRRVALTCSGENTEEEGVGREGGQGGVCLDEVRHGGEVEGGGGEEGDELGMQLLRNGL